LLLSISALVVWGQTSINVPLTVQEAIYPGSVTGIARTAEPVSVGVPLPDSPTAGATDISQLSLSGASVGQFRVLGRWPSGRIKWVLVDTQVNITAGQANTSVAMTSGGTGNFGGSNLATDNGATITVSTGAATFTIRKANFNGIDQAVVGGTTLVASGTSQGLVVLGPAPGQTTCPPCTTVYSSANDATSTAVIEENGPARTVIRASGRHVDSAGNSYMNFTVRLHFYRGKTHVKVTSILRNADYGVSNSFATAYKGHQGYELRLRPAMSGTLNYSFGTHTSTASTGTLTGSDSVQLYQGESSLMKSRYWCGYLCVTYSTDSGYQITKNGTNLLSGTSSQYPQGWAAVSNSSGATIQIGVHHMAAYWPKSLEFNNGGQDVRIGIWARQNSQPYYQSWPQWSIHELYLGFHASQPASNANDFLKFQHFLVGRAALSHYNGSNVFPYQLASASVEDSYFASTGSSANPNTIGSNRYCCLQDLGISNSSWPLEATRFYAWGAGGGSNQTEFRWSALLSFLTRGMTGRYLQAAQFYRFQAESAWPHSDGFNWRDRPPYGASGAELNGFGFPAAVSANSSLSFRNWLDQEHPHWYGMTDYYFVSGDETIRDALLDGTKDYYLNLQTYQAGAFGGVWSTRAVGAELIGAARFYEFLRATGDPDAPGALAQGVADFNAQVKPELCVSGYPAGCVAGPVDGGPWPTQGVSRTRGLHWGRATSSGSWCNVPHGFRELRNAAGPGWADYDTSLDLAYGISRWILSEMYVDNGTGRWDVNGFRYYQAIDYANGCTAPGETPEASFQPQEQQTVSFAFLPIYLVDGTRNWETKFRINLQKLMASLGMTTSDFEGFQPSVMINLLTGPAPSSLVSVPLTNVVHNGGGSYTISWTVPAGASSYRIKWGSKAIVDWIGFDPATNQFTGNPATTMPWFAANSVTAVAPAAAGTTQSITINTGVTGLAAANFSVKAYVAGSSSQTTTLSAVSGNGQTGTAGQVLASPFTVKVADGSGNGVSGVTVTFTVTAGGGSLSQTSVSTNSQGLASSTLTLGSVPGTNTVSVSAPTTSGSPVIFTATGASAGPGPASTLTLVSGNAQSGTPGQRLANPFVVKVTDSNNNAVSGVTVSFAVTAGGGTLTAASAVTNSQGLAESTLTLGPSPGTNTVRASSGTLNGSPITFTATAVAAGAADVTWTRQPVTAGWPNGSIGWHLPLYDSLSQQTLFYIANGNYLGIYSTNVFAYNPSTNLFTNIGGTNSIQNGCPASTPTMPGDRHPVRQMAIDTKRQFLWIYGGMNVTCATNPHQDMYYMRLNANPASNTWTKVNPSRIPLANGTASMTYDPDDDVLFVFGSDGGPQTRNHWVYCRTAENPTPGTLTAKQIAAGCTSPDDWSEVTIAGGGVKPLAVSLAGLFYDTVTKKVILYGGIDEGLRTNFNETWAYDVPTRTWTRRALSTTPPPVYTGSSLGQPPVVYLPGGKLLYHQTTGTGAPADWRYDIVADTWTKLTSSGGGSTYDTFMAYDNSRNLLVSWNLQGEMWLGTLGSGSSSGNSCDVNRDGAVNVLDVQLAVNQVLGLTPCTTADVDGNGSCTVTDLQRIINSSLGGTCQ
jgi:hypothetical protein